MIKETKRKGFNFYRSYYDVFNELTDKDKLTFIKALLDKQFLDVEPKNLTGMVKFAWISQYNSIDQQVKGYKSKTNDPMQGGCQGGVERGVLTPSLQEEEKGEEKGEVECTKKDKSFEERKKAFIKWFNESKLKYTGVMGKSRTIAPSDINNLKTLFDAYEFSDFEKAIPNLFKNDWAKETGNLTISHFIKIANFNKYLEYKEQPKKNAYDI